ncbi:NAD(P)/FAD-dependent oxidoreductase [Roseinatronobacter sp. NSM]|uniref:NAD(P)/FAD-dependent oxidoreductase n=1 Tax=Roseinatronobacter sp. NSM TaxID=3457785 RepID=UPI0040368988
MQRFDVVILGAGAAGLFCAIEAGRRGRRVALIDHARAPGEKIRISGGGRCNFTNLHIGPEKFISQNPRFALSALRRYTQHDFTDRVRRAGIAFHEKTLGQLFCDGSSRAIVAMLLDDMTQAGVQLYLGTSVGAVSHDGSRFTVQTSAGQFDAAHLVVATGGKSIPKMGATGLGYQLAEQFGHKVIETRPALVPLVFSAGQLEEMTPLAGLSVQAVVSCGKARFQEGLLFTHRGLSGPSILQISSYWREGQGVDVNLAPDIETLPVLEAQKHSNGRQAVHTALNRFLPEKLARQVALRAQIQGNLADQSKLALARVRDAIHGWHVVPVGTEGYRTAEVTLGGVDTQQLDARTMESRSQKGLFFIGEVVDVTGWLGGYNFQWAWSSGWAAGQVA